MSLGDNKKPPLRSREPDLAKIKSLISSAKINANVTLKIPLDENSATLVFREIYESIRQIADAAWWIRGFEVNSHEISLQSITGLEIKNKLKLNHLDRFRRIRNEINYRGYRASPSQAKEILDFWKDCSKEIIMIIEKQIK